MNWGALDWGILGPALAAGLLVLATHVALGVQVLDKGIVFIDLAIAQIAGLDFSASSTSCRCAALGSTPGLGSSTATSTSPSQSSM